MTKLDPKYENPIDNIMYKISGQIEPFFKSIHSTPNNITTLSLICGLLCVYFLNNEENVNKYLAFIFYLLAFLFDCLDGYYARKNNMMSKLGDMYDHYKDITIHILIYYTLYNRLSKPNFMVFNLLLVIIGTGLSVQMGCQEKKYEDTIGSDNANVNSGFLGSFKLLCKNPNSTMKITRYFGVGTITLLFALFILLIN